MGRIVHAAITDELLDMLALHAMDMLEPEAADDLEQHLAEGCRLCQEHLKELRQAFAAVAQTQPLHDPPASLRDRIIAAVGQEGERKDAAGPQVWKSWLPEGSTGIHIIRGNDADWQEVYAGISAKRLFVDIERDMVTMLIRMAPGACYVPHRHSGPEQCFVLEGDLRDGDLIVRAGDFQSAARGSLHGAQFTESGCLLLIVSSLRDELLA